MVDEGPSAATPQTTDPSSRPPSALAYPSISVIGALIRTPKIDHIADARRAAVIVDEDPYPDPSRTSHLTHDQRSTREELASRSAPHRRAIGGP